MSKYPAVSSRPQTPNGPECFISICLHARRHEWMTLFNTLGKDTRLSVWERSHTHSKSSGVRLFGQRKTGTLCNTYLRVWRKACVYRASSVEMGMSMKLWNVWDNASSACSSHRCLFRVKNCLCNLTVPLNSRFRALSSCRASVISLHVVVSI